MTIESGSGWDSFAVDDAGGVQRELDAHITQANMATTKGIQDITTLSLSARATLQLLADQQDTFTTLFDDATNVSFDVLKTVGSTSVPRTFTRSHSGQILATEMNISNVTWGRTQSAELTAQVTAVLQDGTLPTWTT